MAPVNFLVQPQDLDEINGKLDTVLALLERWDRERQEAKSMTVPIRTTPDPTLQAHVAELRAASKQKRRAPSKSKKAPTKKAEARRVDSSESSEEAAAPRRAAPTKKPHGPPPMQPESSEEDASPPLDTAAGERDRKGESSEGSPGPAPPPASMDEGSWEGDAPVAPREPAGGAAPAAPTISLGLRRLKKRGTAARPSGGAKKHFVQKSDPPEEDDFEVEKM